MIREISVALLVMGFVPTVFADNICKQVDANGLETFIDCANATKGAERITLEKSNIANMPNIPESSTAPIAPVLNEKPKLPPLDEDEVAPLDEIAPLEEGNVYIEGGARHNINRPIARPLPARPSAR